MISQDLESSKQAPLSFDLGQNYPTPLDPSPTIIFALPKPSEVRLEIFSFFGQRIVTLVNEWREAGFYSVPFDSKNLRDGEFFYRLQADGFVATKKLVLLRME